MVENNNIIYCKYCNSITIKKVINGVKHRYICVDCGKQSNDNTKTSRKIKKGDITIYNKLSSIKKREDLYNFLLYEKVRIEYLYELHTS